TLSTGVAPDTYRLSIPADRFQPPPEGTTHLIVVLDESDQIKNETDEFNNGDRDGTRLEGANPTVELVVSPDSPQKGQGHTANVRVTNNGPVPFNFLMDWQEVYVTPVSLTGVAAGQEILDAEGRRVGWEQKGVPLANLGFKETRTVPLSGGGFMSTWEWI